MLNFLPWLHTPRVKFLHLTFFISQRSILLLDYLFQKDEGAYHRNLQKSTFSAFYPYPLKSKCISSIKSPLDSPSFSLFFLRGGAQLLHRKSSTILHQQSPLPHEPDVVETEYYRLTIENIDNKIKYTTGIVQELG
jgi:hypothetical protein